MADTAWDFDPSKADGSTFVFSSASVAAVRLALTTGRPLLLRGPHGSGKTSLGMAIARVLGCTVYSAQVRPMSTVADLVYRFDQAKQLHDSQILATPTDPMAYVEFGPIGQAFVSRTPAVVLIENIDLASESFQIDIIDLLEMTSFFIRETGRAYHAVHRVVFVLTSGERKKIDPGLVARSLVYVMESPTYDTLEQIGYLRHPNADRTLVGQVTRWFVNRTRGGHPTPGQILELLRIALTLNVRPGDSSWSAVEDMVRASESDPRDVPLPIPSSAGRHEVFLSYAREDQARASALVKRLTAHGWRVFWDRDIPAGRRYDHVISDALEAAKCVVVLWSRASVKSRWVFDEAKSGIDRDVLIPALLEDVQPPLGFRSLQCVDLQSWAISPSDGTAVEPLVRAIQQVISSGER